MPRLPIDLYFRPYPAVPREIADNKDNLREVPVTIVRWPFVTGSRAYGKPTDESDIDVVVRMIEPIRDYLRGFSELAEDEQDGKKPPDYALRFGQLNLICCISDLQYDCWALGTYLLSQERPVSRERAIEVLSLIREQYGIPTEE